MNKRVLRKYADPHIRFQKSNGLLHCSQIKYIVRTAVKNIDGTRMLVLYLYEAEKRRRDNVLRRLRFSRPKMILSR